MKFNNSMLIFAMLFSQFAQAQLIPNHDPRGNTGGVTTTPPYSMQIISSNTDNMLASDGYGGTTYHRSGAIQFTADGTITGTTFPMMLKFQTGTNATTRTDRMVIKSDGKIGIGISAPAALLDVYGVSSTTTPLLRLQSNTAGIAAALRFQSAGTTAYWTQAANSSGTAANDLFSFSHSTYGTVASMNGAGDMGIGTTAPAARLHVYNSSTTTSEVDTSSLGAVQSGTLVIGNRTTGILGTNNYRMVADGNELQVAYYSSLSAAVYKPSTLYLNRYGGTINLMNGKAVLSGTNGFMGIGTASPVYPLHVIGSSDISANGGGYAVFGSTSSTNIAIDNNEIQARSDSAASTVYINYNGGDVSMNNTDLYVDDGIGVGVFTNVIPTGYKFAVRGKAITEELKVQLYANWPDYVFQKNYLLPNLETTEAYIQDKGHLPNMPSAKNIEAEKGFEVGEMTRLQQEKIEEIYLHLIQLNKEIKELKTENQQLKEKILTLEQK